MEIDAKGALCGAESIAYFMAEYRFQGNAVRTAGLCAIAVLIAKVAVICFRTS